MSFIIINQNLSITTENMKRKVLFKPNVTCIVDLPLSKKVKSLVEPKCICDSSAKWKMYVDHDHFLEPTKKDYLTIQCCKVLCGNQMEFFQECKHEFDKDKNTCNKCQLQICSIKDLEYGLCSECYKIKTKSHCQDCEAFKCAFCGEELEDGFFAGGGCSSCSGYFSSNNDLTGPERRLKTLSDMVKEFVAEGYPLDEFVEMLKKE
jgi:hypothetical protein